MVIAYSRGRSVVEAALPRASFLRSFEPAHDGCAKFVSDGPGGSVEKLFPAEESKTVGSSPHAPAYSVGQTSPWRLFALCIFS